MNKYIIIDECRRNLVRYTTKAFSMIPYINNPLVLDAGCGTGVTTLAICGLCDGTVYAVDPDRTCLDRLREQAGALGLSGRMRMLNDSILTPGLFDITFDIILAEGLLNVIGFRKGLSALLSLLKKGGYLIIHDEYASDNEKKTIFRDSALRFIDSFMLDETVWGKEYFECLEHRIRQLDDDRLFRKELEEIQAYRDNPQSNRSILYVLQYE